MSSFLQTPTLLHHAKSLPDLASEQRTQAAAAAAAANSTSQSIFSPLIRFLRYPASVLESAATLSEEDTLHQLLLARLQNAENYDDWHDAAIKLDSLQGNNTWKSHAESPDYDVQLVQSRLQQLEEARISGDVGRMLFLIRTTLVRNLGDMGNVKLYKHSYTGTKQLIEAYIETALQTLDSLVNAPVLESGPSQKKILESLISTRQSYGRTALLLSGGATFGMNHVGVLKSLWEAQLLPRIISGASAGAIVASVLCIQTDDEIPATLDIFPYGDLDVFEASAGEGIADKLTRLLKGGAWIDISHLIRVMKDILGDVTFQEAYNRTRRILNICVSPSGVYELPKLLNYITAPNVLIWSAVAASCSVPFLFSSAELLAKDVKTGLPTPWNPSPQRWIDGSVDNDLPMARLAELFNVNHFIVSQVNPHVVPFLAREELNLSRQSARDETEHNSHSTTTWKDTLVDLAVGEALHRMTILAEMGVFKTTLTKVKSVLSQKYAGDITIFPKVHYSDFPRMLKNPTPEFMLAATLRGEQATWPRLSRIKNHCAVELALDRVIHEMRTRVIFSQVTDGEELCISPEIDIKNFKLAFGKARPKQKRRIRSIDTAIGAETILNKSYRGPGVTTGGYISPIQSRSPTHSRTLASGASRDYSVSRGSSSDLALTPTTPSIRSLPMASKPNVHLLATGASSVSLPIQTDGAEIGALKRVNSRFRMVRQTPSNELDPGDAEDESSAVKFSSSSDNTSSEESELELEIELIPENEDIDEGLGEDFHLSFSRGNSAEWSKSAPGSLRLRTPKSPSVLPNDGTYFGRVWTGASPGGSPVMSSRRSSLMMTGKE